MVAAPEEAGVKTPVALMLPMLDGLTDQTTALLKLPVPETAEAHAEVCVVRMDEGEQVTLTVVTVMGIATVTVSLPDFVLPALSGSEVAVITAVPGDAGVKTPALLTLPMLDGLTDHVTWTL